MTNANLQKFTPVLGVNHLTDDWGFADVLLNDKDYSDWGNCPYTSFRYLLRDCVDDSENLLKVGLVATEPLGVNNECCLIVSSMKDKDIVTSQGIYFVFRDFAFNDPETGECAFECVYVGKTNNLLNRFSQHHKKSAFIGLRCSSVQFIQYSPDFYTEFDLLWAERQYINLLKPILNDCSASYLSNGNSEDAKNKIADDYRLVYEQGYQQGVKDGFASAKNQVIDWFDSNLKAPN